MDVPCSVLPAPTGGQPSSSRLRRSPITRLLSSTRARHNIVSAPSADDASLSPLTHDVALRSCASLPLRPPPHQQLRSHSHSQHVAGGVGRRDASSSTSLSMSMSMSMRGRRGHHRLARRFPKTEGGIPKAEGKDLSPELVHDFFESFAPPSVSSLLHMQQTQGDASVELESEPDVDPRADDRSISAGGDTSRSTGCQEDGNNICNTDSTCASPTTAVSTTAPSTRVMCGGVHNHEKDRRDAASPQIDGTRDGNDIDNDREAESDNAQIAANLRAEVSMLRHLLQAEMREARHVQEARHAQLQDSVNEAMRLATSLEGRMDAMRLPHGRCGSKRPTVELCLTVTDAGASVFLFFLSILSMAMVSVMRGCRGFKRLVVGWRVPERTRELSQRASRSWRLSGREFDDPFLGTVAKRISYSAVTALRE